MREASDRIPKPMIPVGSFPILLHVMKYYAHFGHTDFILCLGYKAQVIERFFRDVREGSRGELSRPADSSSLNALQAEISGWSITFADTGLHTNIGQRLRAVQHLVGDDELFLANYADVLTDAPLPLMIDNLVRQQMVASFLCVQPRYSFHVISWRSQGVVSSIQPATSADIWINGGYFVFRNEIFDEIDDGDELVEQPFQRLIARDKLLGHRHEGFWAPMDTLKDRQDLDLLFESGRRPWAVWEAGHQQPPAPLSLRS
jgi:glucose-1-phosphate cytidylyltransferase